RAVSSASRDGHALGFVTGDDFEHAALLNRGIAAAGVAQDGVEHGKNLIALNGLLAEQSDFAFRLGFLHDNKTRHLRKLLEHRIDRSILEVQNNPAVSAMMP